MPTTIRPLALALAALCFVALAGCSDPPAEEAPVEEAAFERLDPRFDALVPPGAELEVLGTGLEWSEGPVWVPADSAILVSDVPTNTIHRWREGEGLRPHIQPSGHTGAEPYRGTEPGSNGLTLDGDGRLVLAQHGDRQVARREADGSFTTIADQYEGKRFNSPNDLVYGPNGDLYFTDPPYGLENTFASADAEMGFQGVYRVTPEGAVHLVTSELNAPNGIGLSPDGATLYLSNSDSTFSGWMAYPLRADGSVGAGRVFATAAAGGAGSQDGLEVDERGNLFATGPGGVHVLSPEGELLGRILTGSATGNVAWGDDGSVLYIAADDRLLRVRTGTRGAVGFQHR